MRSFIPALLAVLLLAVVPAAAQSFFEPTNGPQGGSLFTTVAANGSTFFIGEHTEGGSIFRSTDGGRTWQQCSRDDMGFGGPMGGRIYTILTRENGLVIAVYTDDESHRSQLYRSESNGEPASWRAIDGLDSAGKVWSLVSGNESTIVAMTDSGLYRSTDNGLTWLRHQTMRDPSYRGARGAAGEMYVLAWAPDVERVRAYRSTDDGVNWSEYGAPMPEGMAVVSTNTLAVTGSGTLLFGSAVGNETLYRLDAAQQPDWEASAAGLPPNTMITVVTILEDGSIYAATESGLYLSTDDGRTWRESSYTHQNPTNGIAHIGSTIVLVSRNTVYRSDDNGATWVLSGDGINRSRPWGIAMTPHGTLVVVVLDVVFRSVDSGQTWQAVQLTLPKLASLQEVASDDEGVLIVGTQSIYVGSAAGGLLLRSTDEGLTWHPVTQGFTATEVRHVITRGGLWFVATDAGIYRSTNKGTNWTAVNTGLPGLDIRRLAIAPNGTLCASVWGNGIYRSTNNGDGWSDANNGITESQIRTLVASPDGTIHAAASRGTNWYRSTDNGATWDDLSSRLPQIYRVWTGAVSQRGDIFLYVLTPDLGELNLRSTDNGESWQAIDSIGFNAATFDAAGRAYITTTGRGVWRERAMPLASVAMGDRNRDERMSITAEGGIHYRLDRAGHVRLELFDGLGRCVTTLIDAELEAGDHRAQVAIDDLPGGLYFCRLLSPGVATTVNFVVPR